MHTCLSANLYTAYLLNCFPVYQPVYAPNYKSICLSLVRLALSVLTRILQTFNYLRIYTLQVHSTHIKHRKSLHVSDV